MNPLIGQYISLLLQKKLLPSHKKQKVTPLKERCHICKCMVETYVICRECLKQMND